MVHVRPLFAIDLDGHEVLVQKGGDFIRLERFAFHDMAPVARGVADRKEDRLVLPRGAVERLGTPGIPVDGIVRVLEEVGALLLGQTVRGANAAGACGVGHASRTVSMTPPATTCSPWYNTID
jgi:hypothetical protein